MYTIAGKDLDFTALMNAKDNKSRDILASVSQEAPDFIKEASSLDDDESDQLPDSHFALILYEEKVNPENGYRKVASHRLFPIHNKAYTWLQMRAIQETGSQLPEEARKVASYHISNAAKRHGIEVPEELEQESEGVNGFNNRVDLTKLEDPNIKVAEHEGFNDDENWAYIRDGERRFPLHTPELVKRAMDYLEQHELTFVPHDRHDYCVKVVDKAKEFELPLTEKIASYGGSQYSNKLDDNLQIRMLYTKDDEEKEALTKLASTKDSIDPRQFSAILHEFDQATKIADRGPVKDAYSSTLGEMGPLSGFTDRQIAGGVVHHQKKLAGYLGKGIVRQLAENPRETYSGLDNEQRDVFHQILSGSL